MSAVDLAAIVATGFVCVRIVFRLRHIRQQQRQLKWTVNNHRERI